MFGLPCRAPQDQELGGIAMQRLDDFLEETPAGHASAAEHIVDGRGADPAAAQCRLLQRGQQVSPDEFAILVVPLVFHGE
jgi:hypothetical protein